MTIRRWLPLFFLLAAVGLAAGQQPAKKETAKDTPKPASKEPAKPTPGSLEDTLEKVLRHSPDIKASEAKVRDAEAELNRTRHQVLTKATALHSDLNLAKRMLVITEQTLARQNELMKTGAIGADALLASQALVEKHKGEVEKLETELKSLRGEFAAKWVTSTAFSPDGKALYVADLDGAVRIWDARLGSLLRSYDGDRTSADSVWMTTRLEAVQTPMADRVKKLLDQVVEAEVTNMTVSRTFQTLLEEIAGTDVPHRELVQGPEEGTITLKGKMALGAWFQAIEDSDPKICIVVRDYGLLMTKKDRMPSSAIGVSDLWKAKSVKPKEEKK